jgi:hypothetical protein
MINKTTRGTEEPSVSAIIDENINSRGTDGHHKIE